MISAVHTQGQWTNVSRSDLTLPTLLSRMGACTPQDDFKGGRSKGSKGSRANRTGSKTGNFQLPTPAIDDDGEATPSQWSQGSPMHHLQTDFSPMYTYARHQDALFTRGSAVPSQASAFPFAPFPTYTLQTKAAPYLVEYGSATLASPYIAEYACAGSGYALPRAEYPLTAPTPVLAAPHLQPEYSCAAVSLDQPERQAEKGNGHDVLDVERTSIMIRNLPDSFKRNMIMEMLDAQGLGVYVDFIYLPTNLRNEGHFGYAFVNFTLHAAAVACIQKLDGFSDWSAPCQKTCEVTWSLTYQGWHAHVERYRNSRIMHETVDDEYKPAVFVNGVRVGFPPPTKSVRAPRLRKW